MKDPAGAFCGEARCEEERAASAAAAVALVAKTAEDARKAQAKLAAAERVAASAVEGQHYRAFGDLSVRVLKAILVAHGHGAGMSKLTFKDSVVLKLQECGIQQPTGGVLAAVPTEA